MCKTFVVCPFKTSNLWIIISLTYDLAFLTSYHNFLLLAIMF